MKINDALGLGKILPLDKLLDVLTKSVGRLSKSYFDKKDIDTKAYEIKMLAEARAEEVEIMSKAIRKNIDNSGQIIYSDEKLEIKGINEEEGRAGLRPLELEEPLENRTNNRVAFQEAKRQLNIENIAAIAAEELKNEKEIQNEPIDEDWTTRFFKISEEISSDEMQQIWGKILAGEIVNPGSYALRTLDLIRNLSKTEADIFMQISKYAVLSGGSYYLFKGNNDKIMSDRGIHYYQISRMVEAGLVRPGTFISHQIISDKSDIDNAYLYGNILLWIKVKKGTKKLTTPVHILTQAGNELMKIVSSLPEMEYLKESFLSWKDECEEIKYAFVLERSNESISHTQPMIPLYTESDEEE